MYWVLPARSGCGRGPLSPGIRIMADTGPVVSPARQHLCDGAGRHSAAQGSSDAAPLTAIRTGGQVVAARALERSLAQRAIEHRCVALSRPFLLEALPRAVHIAAGQATLVRGV